MPCSGRIKFTNCQLFECNVGNSTLKLVQAYQCTVKRTARCKGSDVTAKHGDLESIPRELRILIFEQLDLVRESRNHLLNYRHCPSPDLVKALRADDKLASPRCHTCCSELNTFNLNSWPQIDNIEIMPVSARQQIRYMAIDWFHNCWPCIPQFPLRSVNLLYYSDVSSTVDDHDIFTEGLLKSVTLTSKEVQK